MSAHANDLLLRPTVPIGPVGPIDVPQTSFDLQHGTYYIPVGLGGGTAWKIGSTIYNAFIEPRYSVAH